MTVTTIKVSSSLRDRLKEAARAHDQTISEHIESLLAEQDRRDRVVTLRRQMAAYPPDDTYRAEAATWQDDDAWT